MRVNKKENDLYVGDLRIGSLNDQHVWDHMEQLVELWDRELLRWYVNVYPEYDRCPHCGRKEFKVFRGVTDSIQVGYCLHCRANLIKNDQKLEDLTTGKSGWVMSHMRGPAYVGPAIEEFIKEEKGRTK